MPLVVHALRGRDTHTHAYICTEVSCLIKQVNVQKENLKKNLPRAHEKACNKHKRK